MDNPLFVLVGGALFMWWLMDMLLGCAEEARIEAEAKRHRRDRRRNFRAMSDEELDKYCREIYHLRGHWAKNESALFEKMRRDGQARRARR